MFSHGDVGVAVSKILDNRNKSSWGLRVPYAEMWTLEWCVLQRGGCGLSVNLRELDNDLFVRSLSCTSIPGSECERTEGLGTSRVGSEVVKLVSWCSSNEVKS